MHYTPGLCLAAALCLTVAISRAQSTDSLNAKLTNLSSRLISRIQAKTASLDQQLTSQTQKYVQRMIRQEQQMKKKMYAVDSNSAKDLFNGTEQRYTALSRRL
jgi:exonuclease VII large subunit